MAVGFRAANVDFITQIDETYKNLSIIAEGTATTGNTVTFPTQPYKPLIAISITGPNNWFRLAGVNYSDFTVVQAAPYGTSGSTNFSFAYKVFATTPNNLIQNPYGLEVRDAGNNLIFNSNYKYLQLRYIQDIYYSNFLDCIDATTSMSNNPIYTLNTGLTGTPYLVINGLVGLPIFRSNSSPATFSGDIDGSQPYSLNFSVHARLMVNLQSASVVNFGWVYSTYGVQNYNKFETKLKLILGY